MAESTSRWIGHVDMDAFFAAVEQLDVPGRRGRPVIVGGLGPRGVVSTASYEARAHGVHSALPMAAARARCPHGIYVEPRFGRYQEISRQVRAVVEEFTPRIETVSLDEAFFDLTDSSAGFSGARDLARTIKDRIQRSTGLTCSVGLAPNRWLAKMASELDKPDGFVSIDPEQIAAILDPLPANRLWGVGEVTARRLQQMGILRIRDLRLTSPDVLFREFGASGLRLHELSRGVDDSPVAGFATHRSISRETTYESDIRNAEKLEGEIHRLAEEVSACLGRQQLIARVVRIKIRYADFRTITRQVRVPSGTNSSRLIAALCTDLLRHKVQDCETGVRLLGVGVGDLCRSHVQQLPLFPEFL